MPSTYTDNLGIELPADGELDGVWGDVVNENMNILDRAINGVLSLSLSGTSSTLTTSNGALSDGQYKLLVLTGSPSGTHTITISPNDAQKIYFVRNTTAQSVVFTQGSGGNVTIATGDSGIIYANGAGAGAAVANLTDHFAMSSVNITGGSITGLADLSLSAANPSITFAETDTTDTDARLRLNAGDLLFETVTDAGVQVRENMRIESGGNVGIGTDSPQTALEVSSTTNPTATFIAYISGTTMTVTGITSGALAVGDRVFGAGVEWNTVITAQTSGTTGASGNYTVNNSQTVSTAPTGIAMNSGNAGKSVLRLTNTDTTESANQTTGGIEFYGSDATAGAGVKGYVALIAEDNSPSSALLFGTSADTSTAVAVERMRIDSAGNVGIGTNSPAVALDVVGAGKFSGNLTVDTNTLFVDATDNRVGIGTTEPLRPLSVAASSAEAHIFAGRTATGGNLGDTAAGGRVSLGSTSAATGVGYEGARIGMIAAQAWTVGSAQGSSLAFETTQNGTATLTERMRIDSSGYVGIGTTSPNVPLDVSSTGVGSTIVSRFYVTDNTVGLLRVGNSTTGDGATAPAFGANATSAVIHTNNTERARIDSSGNVGIGTSSPATLGSNITTVTVNGTSGGGIQFQRTDATAVTGLVAAFSGAFALGSVTSTPVTFRTDNTERMRIDANGYLLVGKTAPDGTDLGFFAGPDGLTAAVVGTGAGYALFANRQNDDGVLVSLRQANTQEGNISVSGTTVSYNGGHLSRWAQTTGPKDDTLVKGTVLSNLDEMNAYTDAEGNPVDNEQLNKVKVSDVEGDANVAGVFVNWTYDDQHNVDEINMAMTGDMVIRIAAGTTVQRGDLLMSAGDGTAKPQGDDIVRSKTIAKVTSTHVSHTYADGSYAVPCVLMAC